MNSNYEDNCLTHYAAADNVIHEFYDKKIIIYVEADPDITFWHKRFQKIIPPKNYEMIAVGGKKNFKGKIENAQNEQYDKVVVACDADFTDFLDNQPHNLSATDCLVVRTYGYSIENTMFCPESISEFIGSSACTTKQYTKDVSQWFSEFSQEVIKLLPYAIENVIKGTGDSVFGKDGENYHKEFKKDRGEPNLDKGKIDAFIDGIKNKYTDTSIYETQIKNTCKSIRYLVQGHFLEKAVKDFMKYKIKAESGKNFSINNDMIMPTFCQCNCGSQCADSQFLEDRIERVKKYFSIS
jgi:hypothetical protein